MIDHRPIVRDQACRFCLSSGCSINGETPGPLLASCRRFEIRLEWNRGGNLLVDGPEDRVRRDGNQGIRRSPPPSESRFRRDGEDFVLLDLIGYRRRLVIVLD